MTSTRNDVAALAAVLTDMRRSFGYLLSIGSE